MTTAGAIGVTRTDSLFPIGQNAHAAAISPPHHFFGTASSVTGRSRFCKLVGHGEDQSPSKKAKGTMTPSRAHDAEEQSIRARRLRHEHRRQQDDRERGPHNR